jgi:hypothetical protein
VSNIGIDREPDRGHVFLPNLTKKMKQVPNSLTPRTAMLIST